MIFFLVKGIFASRDAFFVRFVQVIHLLHGGQCPFDQSGREGHGVDVSVPHPPRVPSHPMHVAIKPPLCRGGIIMRSRDIDPQPPDWFPFKPNYNSLKKLLLLI